MGSNNNNNNNNVAVENDGDTNNNVIEGKEVVYGSEDQFKGVTEDDTEELGEDSRSVLRQLLSQIRIGMDLTKILVPVHFLEPRSLLEKITDFVTHCDLITNAMDSDDPVQRMINVVKWYVSGWHVKPKGVKKPYNPALGEIFRCNIDLDDGSRTTYFAEQVSHHPPISAFFGENRTKGVKLEGWYYPRSKLAGMNSAASVAEGVAKLWFTKHDDEEYTITWPNVYARGIILGRLLMEYGGKTTVVCERTNLAADIEFKTKPFFGGEYNVVAARIKKIDSGKVLYTIRGKWNEAYYITEKGKGKEELLFDTRTGKRFKKNVQPVNKQLPNESQRLWIHLSNAIRRRDIESAAEEKHKVEEAQREKVREREANGIIYKPKYFKKDEKENYWHFIGFDEPEYKILFNKMNAEGDFVPEDNKKNGQGEQQQ